jgi:1-acyl-sn-glycerol-3-phosphate acyltransferase
MSTRARSHRPKYEFPRLPLSGFAFDLLLARRRSFARDSLTIMAANPYPRRLEGLDNVPEAGTFVLVMNHYNRPGLHVYHCAMAVSAALSQRRPHEPEVRWTFISEHYGRRIGPVPIPLWLIRWVFRRVARVYDLVVLPRREELVLARAAALRRFARALTASPVGLTPEGSGSGRLVEPPSGSGLFLTALCRRSYGLLPVAVWEENNTLVIRFGEPFRLSLPEELTREERDRQACEQVMVAIGRHLPKEYWGAYEPAIEQDQAGSMR